MIIINEYSKSNSTFYRRIPMMATFKREARVRNQIKKKIMKKIRINNERNYRESPQR